MAKLVDVPDLGSGAARRVGSSPITRTLLNYKTLKINILRVFYFYFCRNFAEKSTLNACNYRLGIIFVTMYLSAISLVNFSLLPLFLNNKMLEVLL